MNYKKYVLKFILSGFLGGVALFAVSYFLVSNFMFHGTIESMSYNEFVKQTKVEDKTKLVKTDVRIKTFLTANGEKSFIYQFTMLDNNKTTELTTTANLGFQNIDVVEIKEIATHFHYPEAFEKLQTEPYYAFYLKNNWNPYEFIAYEVGENIYTISPPNESEKQKIIKDVYTYFAKYRKRYNANIMWNSLFVVTPIMFLYIILLLSSFQWNKTCSYSSKKRKDLLLQD